MRSCRRGLVNEDWLLGASVAAPIGRCLPPRELTAIVADAPRPSVLHALASNHLLMAALGLAGARWRAVPRLICLGC